MKTNQQGTKAYAVSVCAALLLGGIISVLGAQSAAPVQAPAPKTAEQAFKNIQVLKGIPADQVLPSMQFISASLGVECQFCHEQNAFEKDDKKAKITARKMIVMQMAINKDNFEGHRDVTCYSCHRGGHEPVAVPIIADEEPKAVAPAAEAPAVAGNLNPATPPPADPILDKYVQALGGADAIHKISSRVASGNVSFGSRQFPVEVFTKAPDKRFTVVHQPNGDNITAYDGHAGWLGSPGHAPREMSAQENDAVRLDADFYFATDLKQTFNQFRVARPDKIGDRPVSQVLGLRQGQPPVRLYFDQQNGLLLRMVRYTDTPLGRNPTQVDYADFRDSGGTKVPYRWTIARPGGRFTIQVEQIQQNVAIDDNKFVKPAAPPAPPATQPAK